MRLNSQDEARLKALREAKPRTWVALTEDETQVVGEGSSPGEAGEQARANGCAEPIIWKIPPDWRPRVLSRPKGIMASCLLDLYRESDLPGGWLLGRPSFS